MNAVLQHNSPLALNSEKIGRALILLFLIKPTLDLLWFLPIITVGGMAISLLHLTGFLVLVYFGSYLLKFKGIRPPCGQLFKLFIIMNLVSVMVTMFTQPVGLILFVDTMMRMVDSYIIFNVAYFAALNYKPDYCYKLIKAMSIGVTIALIINFLAILAGYEGKILISGVSTRISGLYSDPGVLANVAVYAIILTVFLGNMFPKKSIIRSIYTATVIIVSFYVIYTGLSRSAFIQLCVFGIIYVAIFKKGVVGRLVPPIFLAAVFVAGAMSGFDYNKYVQRFSSEIAVFSGDSQFESGKDKAVNFGKLEQLGSNRGQLAAYALDELLKRPFYQNMLGTFDDKSAHSDYIDVFGRNGLIGLIIYLSLLVMVSLKALRLSLRRGEESIGWKLAVLGLVLITLYILYSFPFRPLHYTTIAWIMWAVLGTMFGAAKTRQVEGGAGTGKVETPEMHRRLVSRKE